MPIEVVINKKEEGVFVVSVGGSIDTETYVLLEKEVNSILDKTTRGLIFDFKNVSYISSMGLSAIFRIKQSLEEYYGTIAIINLQPQIKKVFETVKVLPENYFSTMQEAERHMDEFLADVQQKELDKKKPQP